MTTSIVQDGRPLVSPDDPRIQPDSIRKVTEYVADLRRDLSMKKVALSARQAEFAKDNARLIEEVKRLTAVLADAELSLRMVGLDRYNAIEDPRPGPGLEVKKFDHVEYDPDKALEWALEKRVALLLDAKTFEKIAIANPKAVPIAIVRKLPRVQVATDLDKALAVADVTTPAPDTTQPTNVAD